MEDNRDNPGRIFFATALVLLFGGLIAGILSAIIYVSPEFLQESFGLSKLRPIHVSAVMFWIIIGATGCVYSALWYLAKNPKILLISKIQWLLWIVALLGIMTSYIKGDFGGREYWEFNPIWAIPIALSWILFLVSFIFSVRKLGKWPVYVWMWMTGILFFLFIFLENYLWIFPYFREHFVSDMTIQWKVNGSLVGSINQLLYGTAFFLMDYINKDGKNKIGFSKLAFGMYFLGLTNLMFNWGHHIYTLPTESYIRYVAYAISMTEWIFFVKIIYNWRKSLTEIASNYHFFPYRFIMAADFWVFINMGQAILMSIPAINIFTHGTHVTVAHSMGTTIGINSMIIFAAAFIFLLPKEKLQQAPSRFLNIVFWVTQIALLLLFLSLDISGIMKGIWQLDPDHDSFGEMMESIRPMFIVLVIAGILLLCGFFIFIIHLLRGMILSKKNTVYEKQN